MRSTLRTLVVAGLAASCGAGFAQSGTAPDSGTKPAQRRHRRHRGDTGTAQKAVPPAPETPHDPNNPAHPEQPGNPQVKPTNP